MSTCEDTNIVRVVTIEPLSSITQSNTFNINFSI